MTLGLLSMSPKMLMSPPLYRDKVLIIHTDKRRFRMTKRQSAPHVSKSRRAEPIDPAQLNKRQLLSPILLPAHIKPSLQLSRLVKRLTNLLLILSSMNISVTSTSRFSFESHHFTPRPSRIEPITPSTQFHRFISDRYPTVSLLRNILMLGRLHYHVYITKQLYILVNA